MSGLFGNHVCSLDALRAIFDQKLNFLAFFQTAVAVRLYCGKMDEYIFALLRDQ